MTRRSDYALRAIVELALRARTGTSPVTAEEIARGQGIPLAYLFRILAAMRSIGLVESRRGYCGGYLLARRPDEIVASEVIRAAEGLPPHIGLDPDTDRTGVTAAVRSLWSAVDQQVQAVLDHTTVADLAAAGSRPWIRTSTDTTTHARDDVGSA